MHIFQIIFSAVLAVAVVAGCIKALRKMIGVVSSGLPTNKPRVWRWEGITLAGLFGVGLVLWPLLAFGAIFIFDSPLQNRSDEVSRYTVAYFIWFYPVTYAAAFLLYYTLRRCGVWRWLSCLAWGLPVMVYFILPAIAGWNDVQQTNSRRVQFLYRTDHAAFLAACRGVIANRNSFRHWERNGWEFINPKDPKLPATIAALQPTYVAPDDDSVSVGLHDGIGSLVVIAYSEQFVNSHTNGFSGDLQLMPGLWFSDEEFTYQDTKRADYIKKLKGMKPDDAPTPKW